MLVSGSRSWLRRKEPYIALLIFLVLISPDIYWNVKHPDTTVPTLNYAGHLSRIGGIGFTFHYFLFYGRDAIRGAYHLLGWRLKEYMSEYPSMNTLFGAILLVSVVLTTSHYKREGSVTRFLIALMGYPLDSGNPNILWLGSRGLSVPVGDDRSIGRWVHGDCLLHKAVEEFSPAA